MPTPPQRGQGEIEIQVGHQSICNIQNAYLCLVKHILYWYKYIIISELQLYLYIQNQSEASLATSPKLRLQWNAYIARSLKIRNLAGTNLTGPLGYILRFLIVLHVFLKPMMQNCGLLLVFHVILCLSYSGITPKFHLTFAVVLWCASVHPHGQNPAVKAFEYLPVGAVIEDKILCLHGGAHQRDGPCAWCESHSCYVDVNRCCIIRISDNRFLVNY